MGLYKEENIERFRLKEKEIKRLTDDINLFLEKHKDMLNYLLATVPATSLKAYIDNKPFRDYITSVISGDGNYDLCIPDIRSTMQNVLAENSIYYTSMHGGMSDRCVGLFDLYINIEELLEKTRN